VTGALISDAVPGGRARFMPDREALPRAVAEVARPGDVVMTMGAGDVTKLGPLIITALRQRGPGADTPDGTAGAAGTTGDGR
jgi:UDP-N-acetylmuramate--alanine ligase